MKLGVLTVPLSSKPVAEALEYLAGLGVQAVEIGTGGAPGNAHLDPAAALGDPAVLENLSAALRKNHLTVSALSVHGNPVHPNPEIAGKDHADFVSTLKVAQKLGIDTVITFSGCPGDRQNAKHPNWVTCAWPPEYLDVLKFQWEEVLIPYWKKTAALAAEYGVTKIALEMHPGFCVYNPGTLLRLREAVGPAIGANFDPSHLYWQGIQPVEAIKAMKGAIHHFHAKDTRVDAFNTAVNGVLDTSPYDGALNRSWIFRTVGYGHDELEWRSIISALKASGYDGAVSIEHEDCLMSVEEGLEKAIAFLKPLLIYQAPAEMWWA
ncbi:MAG: sugar phosphate isomerase/epimerase [Clostridiales bacterium]|jgi:sugar phosphate isomerase/epimerase|nr:sugar phosphate isomerase/epimerase [Clostridiales bacterium]